MDGETVSQPVSQRDRPVGVVASAYVKEPIRGRRYERERADLSSKDSPNFSIYDFSKKLWKSLRSRSRIITMLKSKEEDEERTRLGNHARDVSMKRSLKRGQCCVKKKKRCHAEHGGRTRRGSPQFHVHPLFLSLSPSPRLSSSELIADGFFSPQPLPNATHDSKTESRSPLYHSYRAIYLSNFLSSIDASSKKREKEREKRKITLNSGLGGLLTIRFHS